MGLFNETPATPATPAAPTSRNEVFHGTLADIKASPKTEASSPDSRLESLNKGVFF